MLTASTLTSTCTRHQHVNTSWRPRLHTSRWAALNASWRPGLNTSCWAALDTSWRPGLNTSTCPGRSVSRGRRIVAGRRQDGRAQQPPGQDEAVLVVVERQIGDGQRAAAQQEP